MKLILASQSPRRQELLGVLTPDFSVCPADIDETLEPGLSLTEQVARLAARKAEAVRRIHPDAAVIGSDTIVACEGTVLGKPRDEDEARRMLNLLSGRTHQVVTGVALALPNGETLRDATVTKVTFAPLVRREVSDYIRSGEPMDKAGAYGIQGRGARFITGIEGDYYSVMGLPVRRLYEMLRAAEIM